MGKTTSKLSYFVINLSQRVMKLLCMTVFTIHTTNLDNNVLRIMHHCSTTCFMLIANLVKAKQVIYLGNVSLKVSPFAIKRTICFSAFANRWAAYFCKILAFLCQVTLNDGKKG